MTGTSTPAAPSRAAFERRPVRITYNPWRENPSYADKAERSVY
ncbi:hypothetical protein [Streptomyces sp. ISL-43]|nr:hypothetical protein [Streptomyces sp. ISL-43]